MVYFRVSDIASLTGYNRYQNSAESIKKLLQEQLLRYKRKNEIVEIKKNIDDEDIIDIIKTDIVDNTRLKTTLDDLEIKLEKEKDTKIDKIKNIIINNEVKLNPNKLEIKLEKDTMVDNTELDLSLHKEIVVDNICENIIKTVKSKKLRNKLNLIKEKTVSDDAKIELIQSTTENIINEKHNKIKGNVSSFVVKRYGTTNELSAIQLYEKENNCIIYGNNEKLYKQQINNFSICGKIDGFVEINDEKYLVEVKNRQNRFFKYIPDYEKVQIMVYMFLTKTEKAIHIQKYNGSIKHEIFDRVDIFNDMMWDNVIERLNIIADFVEEYKKKDNLDTLFKNGKIDIDVIHNKFRW